MIQKLDTQVAYCQKYNDHRQMVGSGILLGRGPIILPRVQSRHMDGGTRFQGGENDAVPVTQHNVDSIARHPNPGGGRRKGIDDHCGAGSLPLRGTGGRLTNA